MRSRRGNKYHQASLLALTSRLTVNIGRLQVLSVTTSEIAFPARGPEEPDQSVDHPPLDELILLPGLDADQVHAVPPADVTTRQPVNLNIVVREASISELSPP